MRPPIPFQITSVVRNEETNEVAVTWDSKPGASYSISHTQDLVDFAELDDGIEAVGESTTFVDKVPADTKVRYYQVTKQ